MTAIEVDAPGLLEREQEIGRIDAALAAVATGTGGALTIEGAAGIGKSRLLVHAAEAAPRTEVAVLAARGRELETGFAFGVVRQLLERTIRTAAPDRRAGLLSGAAALATPVLLPEEASPSTEDGGFPLLHGLYWTLANLADEGPLLLCVDDLHWADAASRDFLGFLAPRLGELPVLLLATTRPSDPEGGGAPPIDRDSAPLRPRPLSTAAVADLIAARLDREVDAEFAAACRVVTGGNPFLLRELIGELASARIEPVAESVPRVEGLGPEAVGRVVLGDLAGLSEVATPLARATAVLETARLEDAASLAGVPAAAARPAADELAAAGVLAGGMLLQFRHALVRNAIYSDIPAQARSQLHRRAATLLRDDPAGPAAAAAHLLRAAPGADREAAELLHAAGLDALRRGSPAAAAGYLRRAAAEPPPAARRGEVLRALARAESYAGSPGAIERYEEAIPLLEEVAERCEATRELAALYAMENGAAPQARAVEALENVLADLDEEDEVERVALECDLVCFARIGVGVDATVESHVRRLRALADSGWRRDSRIGRRVLVRAAYDAAIACEPLADVRALLDPALDDGRWLEFEPIESAHSPIAAFTLMAGDDYDAAEALLTEAIAASQKRGSAIGYAQASCYRSMVALRRGALAEAEPDARTGIEAAGGLTEATPLLVACLADTLLEQGRLAEAEATLAADGFAEGVGETHFFLHLLELRGRLRLAAGEAERALEDLDEAVRVQRLLALENPALISAGSTAARAYLALGDRETARALAAEELGLARRFGARRAIGVALSVLGLAAGGEAGIELMREAVAALAGSGAALQHARAEIELGAALRRAGARREARKHLERGLDGAERCGAAPLVERAREELLASGARPRRARLNGLDSLTASERRVAQMAAAGLSNPEIAQRLFVTRKTVEVHLSHCYRKLGIASRTELGEALAKD
ncbi:MAG: AAA family ATPase [Actinobacteria bacterium]|nr:AAA family ATPase [Actinomycetota bacterium]